MKTEIASLVDEIRERSQKEEFFAVPASIEEFFEVREAFDFVVEYLNDEIIIMSKASYLHEKLVMLLGRILGNFYEGTAFEVIGSKIGIHLKGTKKYISPDVTVVKGEPRFETGDNEISNPYLVIEILSTSTAQYDLTEKLALYKEISSLQQIIFVNQNKAEVITYTRTNEPNVWLNIDYKNLNDTVVIDNLTIPMAKIYENIEFAKK